MNLKYHDLMKNKINKYRNKLKAQVVDGNQGSIYKLLRRLGNAPGDTSRGWFDISSHLEDNLSSVQSAERIALFFSAISQEYQPLSLENLPPNIKNYLSKPSSRVNLNVADSLDLTLAGSIDKNMAGSLDACPILTEHQVYLKIKSAK